MPAPCLELVARFERTIWEAEDKSSVIASVVDEGGEQRTVKGPGDAGPKFQQGLSYRFHGEWQQHIRYGRQFVFGTYVAIRPHDKKGVIAYLTSIAEDVGEKRAARLWDTFGADAVEVLRTEWARVVDAGIMTNEAAREASDSLNQESAFEGTKIDLLSLFAGRGFHQGKLIKECLRKWGRKAPERIRKNPYLLLFHKLPSAGFKRCDRLYLDLGLKPSSLKRQALCAWNAIVSDSSGHTWHEGKRVARAMLEQLPQAEPVKALRLAIRGRLLAKHKDDGGVWLAERKKAHNEATVADRVREMVG